ncbi:hypothetical protein FJZ40_00175 [Candidatus Shapirobacteria bacterium]|nr:hypothetical protein [Candidatus Shapirobacteria bacterium]
MIKIASLAAREIFDSQGGKTIEAELFLADGKSGRASVPAGISTGQWEARKVSADQAVRETQGIIYPVISKREFIGQEDFDKELENFPCGANATLAVSLAFSRAASTLSYPQELVFPKLMVLLFEGAKHGSKNLTIQEFLYIAETVEQGQEAYQKIKDYLRNSNYPTTVGAEGGFSPPGLNDEQVLEIITKVLGKNSRIALDIAESSRENQPPLDYERLVKDFPIISLEDPCLDDDWDSWIRLTASLPDTMIVVDDLTATNAERIKKAAELKAGNAAVIKPDQRSTLTRVLEAVKVAKNCGLKTVVSHRGQDTNDPFAADFAVAIGADYVKFGGFARGERIAKYNRLLELKNA